MSSAYSIGPTGTNGRPALRICHDPTSRSDTKPVIRLAESSSKISTLDLSVTTSTPGCRSSR